MVAQLFTVHTGELLRDECKMDTVAKSVLGLNNQSQKYAVAHGTHNMDGGPTSASTRRRYAAQDRVDFESQIRSDCPLDLSVRRG
jgi:hypothetical protein